MMQAPTRPVIFSGIQPSGHLNLGSYLGALRNWVRLQDEYACLYCVVDLHAITVRQDPKEFAQRCLSFPAQYIAAGVDPDASLVFLQSHVNAHPELAWLLNCNAYMGELSRMTQFKAKTQGKTDKNIGVGLFDYPVLMAADILLYQTALVPVGADQKQHLELTRDIAIRMNNLYGPLYTVPEPDIGTVGARVMSLQDPTTKMSKSDPNAGNYISMLDEPETIRKKLKRAVMDSIQGITYEPDTRPGVANLLTIYGALTDEAPETVAARFADSGNAALKEAVTEVVIEALRPFQTRYQELMKNEDYLRQLLRQGAEKAQKLAEPTLRATYEALGFLRI
jgi:tryptophanyl-tRNA synthetase